MTLGGMLKHLAYVEDWWLNQVYAGNPEPEPWASVDWKADPDWDWHSADPDSAERARVVPRPYGGGLRPGPRTRRWPHPAPWTRLSQRNTRRDPSRQFNLRWILVHMIEEYARHNGHADLIRESIDGSVGE